eukprot:1133094-Rhodomonas_salina.1
MHLGPLLDPRPPEVILLCYALLSVLVPVLVPHASELRLEKLSTVPIGAVQILSCFYTEAHRIVSDIAVIPEHHCTQPVVVPLPLFGVALRPDPSVCAALVSVVVSQTMRPDSV